MEPNFNRLHNVSNPHQGPALRVLCVCSAGLLRSPTLARVLSRTPYNFNTRAAGHNEEYALIQVDKVLLSWADVVIFAEKSHQTAVNKNFSVADTTNQVVLRLPDVYGYNDPRLVRQCKKQLAEVDFNMLAAGLPRLK